jgi:hypothetical protein
VEGKRGGTYRLPTNISSSFILSDTTHGMEWTPVCMEYLRFATDLSYNQIRARRKDVSKPDGNGAFIINTIAVAIQVWLLALGAMYLVSPDSDYKYLPFSSKKVVWELYKLDIDPEEGVPECDESYFYRVWRTQPAMKKIAIHKWSKFTHCDDCEDFKAAKKAAGRDRTALRDIKKREKAHHRANTADRVCYAQRIREARDAPDAVMSINIDAADQAAYGYPYYCRQSKAQASMTKFRSHLMGAIVHGRGTYAWTFCDNIKHGNNLTVECLHQIIEHQAQLNGGKLPRKLYLQLDNTAKQCKGTWLYIFVLLGGGCIPVEL